MTTTQSSPDDLRRGPEGDVPGEHRRRPKGVVPDSRRAKEPPKAGPLSPGEHRRRPKGVVPDSRRAKEPPKAGPLSPGDVDAAVPGSAPSVRQVPGFELIRELGSGGMAIVFEAIRGDEVVALKLLTATTNEIVRLRFRLEGELLVSLDHPCLVRGLNFRVTPTTAWIAMEYLEGCTLSGLVHRPTFTLGDRMDVILSVARAVEYLHDNGVVHRDVKPENIFVLADGTTRLLDLGIARMDALDLTPHGTLTASPYSIAPEEILECGVDQRVDVFSIGVVMHHLLTGVHPWPNKNLYATMYARCANVPPSVADLEHESGPLGLPPEDVSRFGPVVLKALARDPDDRFQCMRSMITAIEDLL